MAIAKPRPASCSSSTRMCVIFTESAVMPSSIALGLAMSSPVSAECRTSRRSRTESCGRCSSAPLSTTHRRSSTHPTSVSSSPNMPRRSRTTRRSAARAQSLCERPTMLRTPAPPGRMSSLRQRVALRRNHLGRERRGPPAHLASREQVTLPAVSEGSPGRLEGKVAVVTGGARGTGAAVARRFAAEGARVIVADVLDDRGGELVEAIGATGALPALRRDQRRRLGAVDRRGRSDLRRARGAREQRGGLAPQGDRGDDVGGLPPRLRGERARDVPRDPRCDRPDAGREAADRS